MPRLFSFLTPVILIVPALVLSSCATSPPSLQPQVNALVVGGQFSQAVKTLDSGKKTYGKNNQLLYLLDKGLVLHLAGQYADSIAVFEQAKRVYDDLYTRSLTKMAATWTWNDYAAPYRGEDFERVQVNIFQAVNFAALGRTQEALVEARDVDRVLQAINGQYRDRKNAYREDAFARLLSGILYETVGGRQNLNDALIDYRKALAIYDGEYKTRYGVEAPLILKQNLLAAAQYFGEDDFSAIKKRWPGVTFATVDEKNRKAEIYLIEYYGLAPVKIQEQVALPAPDGYLTKIAFPRYQKRYYEPARADFSAQAANSPAVFIANVEPGQNIEGIAIKNLEDHKVRVMAKSALRPLAKYLLERDLERRIQRKNGDTSAQLFRGAASLFNYFSEQADLRSWQTLPAQIRVARVLLEPGDYQVTYGGKNLGQVQLNPGDKKFYVVRTNF